MQKRAAAAKQDAEDQMCPVFECSEPAIWDAAVLTLPQPHILQSWAWGELKLQTGWRAKRLLWSSNPHSPRTPPQSASADLPCQTANSFADLAGAAHASATPNSSADLAGAAPASATPNSFADLAAAAPASAPPNSFADLAGAAPAIAAAALLIRRLHPRVPISVAYVPKGPLLDWSNETLAETVLARLEAEARRARALFVKIDPDVRSDTPAGQAVMARLTRRGWRPSAEQIQFRNTVVSDLTMDEETLLAAMKPKWRYNIRLAERKAVAVRTGEATDLQTFYTMYAETGARDGFLVRPFAYYRAIWERFLGDGLAHVLLAEVAGTPIAGLILFRYGPTAWYFYGASTAQGRELMPNHALQWAAMRWARAVGCTRYDWWGAPDVLDESDPMWGVYRFKQGFGGKFTPHIGAWDYPTNRFAYWGYTVAMPRVLDAMRHRHRQA